MMHLSFIDRKRHEYFKKTLTDTHYGIAGLFLSRSAVQCFAHAFDDVLGGDDAAGQIDLGRRQVNH
ncbi:hypothetical protein, partial [Enterobacter cloacae]|uniref:hypothetical protein n=1 Tax=Enterobacter cloacae TaxID=550 RepID=UPI0013C2B44C